MATRCAYKNPGAVDVKWGENTADAMGYAFAAYYPKITSAQGQWSLPAIGAKCAPTP